MVKRTTKSAGTSRVRFIMLEAEMPEGDLAQITTAIQNALKPAGFAPARITRDNGFALERPVPDDHAIELDDEQAMELEEAPKVPKAPARSKKPAKRKVLDIDLETETAFTTYIAQHPPKTEQDRHLLAVAYFQEHRPDIEGVTVDHVYTCFRKAGWSAGKADFGQPLRSLKSSQLISQGPKVGTYEPTHIGMDRVNQLME